MTPFLGLTLDKTRIRALAAGSVLALVLTGHTSLAAQETLARAEALAQLARTESSRFAETKDGRAQEAAGKALKDGEKILRDLLKSNASCEKCQEELVWALLMRSVLGLTKNYDECLDEARKGITRFPSNGRIALLQGIAQVLHRRVRGSHQIGEELHGLAIANAGSRRFGDPDLLQDSQQRFLTSWYRQANFYQSPESRLTRLNPQTFANEVTFQVTPEWELGLANQLAPALAQQGPPVSDPAMVGYLEQLVARLVKGSPGPTFTYRTTIFNSALVNATALPGHIAVSTGLLQFVESEAELAAVLAHELAHTYGHHAARAVLKQYTVQNLVASVTQAVNPQGAVAQGVTGIVAGLGLALFQRAYSRFEENEADLYGAHILYNGGFNPTAMSQVQLRMYQRNPSQPIKFLSTHPPAPDRVETLTTYLEAFALDRELSLDSATFQKIVKGQTAAAAPPTAAQVAAAPPAVSRAPAPNPIPTAGSLPAATSLPPVANTPAAQPAQVASDLPPVQSPGATSLPPADALPPVGGAPRVVAPGASGTPPPPNPTGRPASPNAGAGTTVPDGAVFALTPDTTPGVITREPVPPPTASAAGDDEASVRMRGNWTSRTGDLVVRFSQTSDGFIGYLLKVPPSWAASKIEEGDRLFDKGQPIDRSTMRGQSLSLAPPGCTTGLQYGPATITVDATGRTFTMIASEPRTTPAPGCRATSQIETKTYTFYRAPAR